MRQHNIIYTHTCMRESLFARHNVHIVVHYAAAHNMHEKSVRCLQPIVDFAKPQFLLNT